MKKLLLLTFAATAALCTNAQVTEPTVLDDYCITAISANGKWTVSCDEMSNQFIVTDWENDKSYMFFEEDMKSAGTGHCVSNTGVVVGSSVGYVDADQPYYWEDNEWYPLPLTEGDYGAFPQAITPDGTRIVGSVLKRAISTDDGDVMTIPVVWNRNDQGSYDMYQTIPHPNKDWTGRIPQYILINDCSADGKVLAGDMVDYSGFVNQPIVFKEVDGEWSYSFVQPQLLNPDEVEFPELPAEPKEPKYEDYMTDEELDAYEEAVYAFQSQLEPEPTDFMTPEELQAYYDAIEAYETDWENNPYPLVSDFMTEEEYQAYLDADNAYWSRPMPKPEEYMTEAQAAAYTAVVAEYEVAFDEWQGLFWNFDELMTDVIMNPDVVSFSMNSARISPNGRYYIMSAEIKYDDPTSWFGYSTTMVPYLFDLQTDEYSALEDGVTNVYATMVTDDGWVLGGSPANTYSRNGVLAKGAGEPFVSVAEILRDIDPELYDWIEENMKHEVTTYDYIFDEDSQEYVEVVNTEELMELGTPVASDGMEYIASWVYNNWEEDGVIFYSYVIPVKGGINGVKTVAKDTDSLRVFGYGKGRIGIIGNAASICVYDMDGRMVYSADKPGSAVSTGLGAGAYIIRAVTADGTVVNRKVAL